MLKFAQAKTSQTSMESAGAAADVLQDGLADPLLAPPLADDEVSTGEGDDTGGLGESGERRITVADAGDVVKRSNKAAKNGGDPFWTGVNGTDGRVSVPSGKAKPSEWSRGIILVEEVQPDGTTKKVPKMVGSGADGVTYNTDEKGQKNYTDGDASMAAELGIDSYEAYKERLVADFDFGGVISKYLELGSDKAPGAFMDDMLDRYAPEGSPEGQIEKVTALSRELWSYATTGADSTGNTDIAQMQGILYAIDAEIVKTSDGNTKMREETFTLPGTDIQINVGDGVHGRATTLTTRHLLGFVEGGNDELEGYEENLVFVDISGSMTAEMEKLGGLMEAGNIDGDVQIMTFHDGAASIQYVAPPTKGTTSKERAKHAKLYKSFNDAAAKSEQAFRDYRADTGNEEKKALSKELRVELAAKRKAFELYNAEINKRTPEQAAAVLQAAGEGTSTDKAFDNKNTRAKNEDGSVKMNESGIDTTLSHLRALPVPEVAPVRPFKRQIMIMTDETDTGAARLKDLKREADKRGYTVRILFSLQQGGEAKTFKIIELDKVDLAKLAADIKKNTRHLDQLKKPGARGGLRDRGAQDSFIRNKGGNGKGTLDWDQVAKAQGAETKSWDDYTVQ